MAGRRSCDNCYDFYNMLFGRDYRCGLGFEVEETLVSRNGKTYVATHPYQDRCLVVPKPKSKKQFVEIAASRGIQWDIRDVHVPGWLDDLDW